MILRKSSYWEMTACVSSLEKHRFPNSALTAHLRKDTRAALRNWQGKNKDSPAISQRLFLSFFCCDGESTAEISYFLQRAFFRDMIAMRKNDIFC